MNFPAPNCIGMHYWFTCIKIQNIPIIYINGSKHALNLHILWLGRISIIILKFSAFTVALL